MSRLVIPDSAILEAVNAIALLRSKNEASVNRADIEHQVRSYVYLGTMKLIPDWTYKLVASEKDSIVTATLGRSQDQYSKRLDFAWVYNNFEIMETLSSTGDLQVNVARPREAEEAYEAQLVDAHANDLNPIMQGIQNFFGVAKSTIEAALKGLGINLPIEAIIVLAVAVLVVILIRRQAPA